MNNKNNSIALFEPWSFGDAIIAARAACHLKQKTCLFIHPRFQAAIKKLLMNYPHIEVRSVDLGYTKRGKGFEFLKDIMSITRLPEKYGTVYSIRGDFRDFVVMRQMFPRAKIKTSGWVSFFARKLRLLDSLIIVLRIPVRNRYKMWTDLLAISPVEAIGTANSAVVRENETSKRVLIHVGAQWRSKAYPASDEVGQLLAKRGRSVTIGYGPGDQKPSTSLPTLYLDETNIVEEIKKSSMVVANDSSPLHLAAFLGCKVLAVCNVGNIHEWLPPGAHYIASPSMPIGYQPRREYSSDDIASDWPSPSAVVDKIETL